MPILRRSSTGSLSGYESESALVSQMSFQTTDTQAVLQLNFALPRYILMLDIWLSQVCVCLSVCLSVCLGVK